MEREHSLIIALVIAAALVLVLLLAYALILRKTQNISPTSPESALVSRVIDGDTVEISGGTRIRLLGINAPEMGQNYYGEAKERLEELVLEREVLIESDEEDTDQYGRLLRYVFVNNENVNVKLVEEGLATVYTFRPDARYREQLEEAWNECLRAGTNLCSRPDRIDGGCGDCIGISNFQWNAEGNDCENLNGEYVVLMNTCPDRSCDMGGWTVKDESSRDPYVFPDGFVLQSQSTATLHTGCGTDLTTGTDMDLYWCSSGYNCNAIWNNNQPGDTLYLRNAEGALVLEYGYEGI